MTILVSEELALLRFVIFSESGLIATFFLLKEVFGFMNTNLGTGCLCLSQRWSFMEVSLYMAELFLH